MCFFLCVIFLKQNHIHGFSNENYIPDDVISFAFQISANVPTLACRKRPISCALSLQKEVCETTDKHGSCR
jgi:hypothetical protein